MTITSRDNPMIRQTRRLLSDAKARRKEGLFVIEGARLCADAAISGVAIRFALLTDEAAGAYAGPVGEIAKRCDRLYRISSTLARQIGDTVSPQGIFCVCETLDNRSGFDTIGKKPPRTGWLALENIQDPANLGAMIRTAEAFGLDGLLLSSDCCDLYNPKVLRGSMGGVFRLPLVTVEGMASAVSALQERGFTGCACVADREAEPITGVPIGPRSLCVVGNEGAGLRPETARVCVRRLTIPMAGRAESLNAATAAGIVMWEMARSR